MHEGWNGVSDWCSGVCRLALVLSAQCRFLRFPGGCYVEGGPLLKDRFQWKEALGPSINRPGHWNAQWGYWSTDGARYCSSSAVMACIS